MTFLLPSPLNLRGEQCPPAGVTCLVPSPYPPQPRLSPKGQQALRALGAPSHPDIPEPQFPCLSNGENLPPAGGRITWWIRITSTSPFSVTCTLCVK